MINFLQIQNYKLFKMKFKNLNKSKKFLVKDFQAIYPKMMDL